MLSGIMMNLGNYPGDTASQEMIAKYKKLHSAAERVANLTYQTEMARAQLQATHLEYMKACMNFEMRGNMGDAKEAKKREVAWKEQLENGPPEKAPPAKNVGPVEIRNVGDGPPFKAPPPAVKTLPLKPPPPAKPVTLVPPAQWVQNTIPNVTQVTNVGANLDMTK